MATFCFQCVTSFFEMKKQRNLNYFQDNYLSKLKFGREGYFWALNSNSSVKRHFDVTMTKRQNTHIQETEKVYDVIMTLFFNQNL